MHDALPFSHPVLVAIAVPVLWGLMLVEYLIGRHRTTRLARLAFLHLEDRDVVLSTDDRSALSRPAVAPSYRTGAMGGLDEVRIQRATGRAFTSHPRGASTALWIPIDWSRPRVRAGGLIRIDLIPGADGIRLRAYAMPFPAMSMLPFLGFLPLFAPRNSHLAVIAFAIAAYVPFGLWTTARVTLRQHAARELDEMAIRIVDAQTKGRVQAGSE